MPKIITSDALTIAANDLVEILKDSKTNLNLYLQPEHYSALKQITKIFNTASKEPPLTLKPPSTPKIIETTPQETENIRNKPPQTNKVLPPVTATKNTIIPTKLPNNVPISIPFNDNELDKRFDKYI